MSLSKSRVPRGSLRLTLTAICATEQAGELSGFRVGYSSGFQIALQASDRPRVVRTGTTPPPPLQGGMASDLLPVRSDTCPCEGRAHSRSVGAGVSLAATFQAPFEAGGLIRLSFFSSDGVRRNPKACRAVDERGRTVAERLSPTSWNSAEPGGESGRP